MLTSILLMGAALASEPACTTKEAARAEAETTSLKSWVDLFRSYDRFRHCDDGTIAEGYSSAVGGMLSQRWGDIEKLGKIVDKHPDFKSFVLRHVDETMPVEVRDTIKHNANNACPVSLFVLCAEIAVTVAEVPHR
jgi:hypothetical protein